MNEYLIGTSAVARELASTEIRSYLGAAEPVEADSEDARRPSPLSESRNSEIESRLRLPARACGARGRCIDRNKDRTFLGELSHDTQPSCLAPRR